MGEDVHAVDPLLDGPHVRWQRGDLGAPDGIFREVLAQAPAGYPTVAAVLALAHAEAGDSEAALRELGSLAALGWENVADDQSEGVSLALAAAACAVRAGTASTYEIGDVFPALAGML